MTDDHAEEWPSFLRPRLRLFFGVDLVGSTPFKQKGKYPLQNPASTKFDNLGAAWFSEIANSYRGVEQHFSVAWDECRHCYQDALSKDLSEPPSLWKSNGDELIYTLVLNEPDEVAYVLLAWFKALRAYRSELKGRSQDLDIKGAAWVAEFPIDNAEVVFCQDIKKQVERYKDEDPKVFHFSLLEQWYQDEESRAGLAKDYVGPAIDTGFRVSSQAQPRKFVVSLETAMILSTVVVDRDFCEQFDTSNEMLNIAFDGLVTFKGLLGGKPYPLFWVDFLLPNDRLTMAYQALDPATFPPKEKVLRYCEEFIEANSTQFNYPFIHGWIGNRFQKKPENYTDTLNKLAARWLDEKKRLEIRWESMRNDDPPRSEGEDQEPSDEPVTVQVPHSTDRSES